MVSGAVYDPGENTPEPSVRSLRGLDAVNLLMADVRDGVGPYLAVFLKSQSWDAGAIGIAMAVSSLAASACQIPAGLIVDGTKAKRALIVASGLLVGTGCLAIVLFPQFLTVIGAKIALGAASALIPPAIAALSLGLVGRRLLDARISRNESFNHGGNLLAAGLAGVLGQYLGYDWIFYLVCAFALASTAAVALINPAEIDHDRARGGEDASRGGRPPLAFRELLRQRDLRVFLISVVLFHFGNAAMLPMAGQVLAQTHPGTDAIALSACIIAAQLVMVGVAWAVGRASARGFGRKPIFLLALAVLPVRGVLFSFSPGPYAVVGIQLFDGVAAGIFGVISVLIASDLMQGTGRFNLAQGLTALATGVGASLSNASAGYVVEWFGYPAGFLYLAGIAACALAFFALLMPETKDSRPGEAVPVSPKLSKEAPA